MTVETFTILIGSYARGASGPDSDLDILRIGHTSEVFCPDWVNSVLPISYIDYDLSTFMDLYQQGSLFLYHSFTEGILLDGNTTAWNLYRKGFSVIMDHSKSIREYISVLEFIDTYPLYEFSYMPFLSNIFKCFKNIGIFRLAESGNFIFDKKTALVEGCGIASCEADLFISANNSFERSLYLSSDEKNVHRLFAQEWKSKQQFFIQRVKHDLR